MMVAVIEWLVMISLAFIDQLYSFGVFVVIVMVMVVVYKKHNG